MNWLAIESDRMWPTTVFSLCLLTVSMLLIWTHIRAWKAIEASEPDERERRFGLAQFRRRIAASSMIGLIGVALLASPRMVDPTRASFGFYWIGVLLAVMAIGLLALFDLVATRFYYRQLYESGIVERAVLKAKLNRLRAHRRNGDHR